MYKTRQHFSNGFVSIAIDNLTGELLELQDEKSGDNLIKNSVYMLPQPFVLVCKVDGKEELCELSSPNLNQISEHPEWGAVIKEAPLAAGGQKISVSYEQVTDGKEAFDISVTYTVIIPPGKAETVWITCSAPVALS
jgi:hypothetical protein